MTRDSTAYVETAIARCPGCSKRAPGHVRVLQPAGIYSWTCPVCGHVTDPYKLDTETVEVEQR